MVAAALLLDHSWTESAEVPALGPESLSMNEMAKIMSEVLSKPVRFQQISFDTFQARLKDAGMSEAIAGL